MKHARTYVGKLGPYPREVLSCPVEALEPVASLATLYIGLTSSTATPIGVRLVAGCLGHRQVVGAAGILPGFDGLAVVASGIVADAWHVEAWGGASDVSLTAALGIRQCCAGLWVDVPAELQRHVPLIPATAAGELAAVLPLGRERGKYRVESQVTAGAPANFTLAACERLLRLAAVPAGAPAVTCQIPGQVNTFQLPGDAAATAVREIRPNGNAEGPGIVTVTGADHCWIELVR